MDTLTTNLLVCSVIFLTGFILGGSIPLLILNRLIRGKRK